MSKKLIINIPLIKALQQIPKYMKFLNDIITKRRRIGEFETIALTNECSLILQPKLIVKIQVLGSFTIPFSTSGIYCRKVLRDLKRKHKFWFPSPFSNNLGICEARPITINLHLVDKSICYPQGRIDDLLVKVDKFVFPIDFIILDFKVDEDIHIILGRYFHAIGLTLFEVKRINWPWEWMIKNMIGCVVLKAASINHVSQDQKGLMWNISQKIKTNIPNLVLEHMGFCIINSRPSKIKTIYYSRLIIVVIMRIPLIKAIEEVWG